MTWVAVVITPVILVYDTIYDDTTDSVMFYKLAWLVWLSEISWCLKIVLSFFVASEMHRDFKSIARNYLKGFFIFDALATFLPLVTLQQHTEMAGLISVVRQRIYCNSFLLQLIITKPILK